MTDPIKPTIEETKVMANELKVDAIVPGLGLHTHKLTVICADADVYRTVHRRLVKKPLYVLFDTCVHPVVWDLPPAKTTDRECHYLPLDPRPTIEVNPMLQLELLTCSPLPTDALSIVSYNVLAKLKLKCTTLVVPLQTTPHDIARTAIMPYMKA
jgi:hypothetical protein